MTPRYGRGAFSYSDPTTDIALAVVLICVGAVVGGIAFLVSLGVLAVRRRA